MKIRTRVSEHLALLQVVYGEHAIKKSTIIMCRKLNWEWWEDAKDDEENKNRSGANVYIVKTWLFSDWSLVGRWVI